MIDAPLSIWATDGEGISAWIKLELKESYLITRLEYKDRDNNY